jgi:hypothetical protein
MRSVAIVSLLSLLGCGDPSAGTAPRVTGGSSGTGGSLGSGGTAGNGGAAGAGGALGTGGSSGTGGSAGTGGTAGAGGTGGSGYSCTNALCHTCPDVADRCNSDVDCPLPGSACIPTGCETEAGAAIKTCLPPWGPSCFDVGDCPNATDYECGDVGAGKSRCLRVTAGCTQSTESVDCAPGFSCEGGSCVDRRIPCDSYLDCPKNHVCHAFPAASSSYCVRANRDCNLDSDCVWYGVSFGSACTDVDGDTRDECIGALSGTDNACENAFDCGGGDPVCESAPFGNASTAACGDYGLCLTDGDCDTANDFECVGLWQDGRKECVPTPELGNCDQVTDCLPPQVCAAPRGGGPPRCQSGKEAT